MQWAGQRLGLRSGYSGRPRGYGKPLAEAHVEGRGDPERVAARRRRADGRLARGDRGRRRLRPRPVRLRRGRRLVRCASARRASAAASSPAPAPSTRSAPRPAATRARPRRSTTARATRSSSASATCRSDAVGHLAAPRDDRADLRAARRDRPALARRRSPPWRPASATASRAASDRVRRLPAVSSADDQAPRLLRRRPRGPRRDAAAPDRPRAGHRLRRGRRRPRAARRGRERGPRRRDLPGRRRASPPRPTTASSSRRSRTR